MSVVTRLEILTNIQQHPAIVFIIMIFLNCSILLSYNKLNFITKCGMSKKFTFEIVSKLKKCVPTQDIFNV